MNKAALGLVLSLGGWAAFALSDLFAKLLAGSSPPFEVAFCAGLFGLLLLPNVKKKDEAWHDVLPRRGWNIWLLRAVAVFSATSLSVEAFMLLPMPEALALMFLMPLVTNILQLIILRESISASSWIATILGFVGVLIVLRPGFREIGMGEICALGVSVALGLSVISYRMAPGVCSDLSLYAAGLAGLFFGDGALMLAHFAIPADFHVILNLFGYGFLYGIGFLLTMLATKLIPPSRVSLGQYSQMIWCVLFSWAIFHDHLDTWTIVGIAVVTLSGGTGWIYRQLHLLRRGKLIF